MRPIPRARHSGWWIAGLLALLVALSIAPLAFAVESASREAELETIRGEIATLQAGLERVRLAASGLETDLEAVRLELDLQERRVAEAGAAHALALARVTEHQTRVDALERDLAALERRFSDRVSALYRSGRHGYLRMFLSLSPQQDLLGALRWLRFLARRDEAWIEELTGTRARLATERDDLEIERRRAAAWLDQQRSRRRDLARLEERRGAMLAGATRESERLAERAKILVDRERKLSELLDFLAGRETGGETGRPATEFRGVLDWPVVGEVVVPFGPRLDPRYRTKVPHHGIKIAAPSGSAVRVVYPGRVIFAAPFESFGPTVVVSHSGRVLTLYAGLSDLQVGKDGVLAFASVIGRLGAGPLYFEIRVENRPEDPLSWLR